MEKKAAIFILSGVILITGILAWQLPGLRFNYVFEDFFPTDDPDMNIYREFVDKFETDNDYLLIGLINDRGLFDSTFLRKADTATSRLKSLPHSKEVTSLTTLKQAIISPAGTFFVPWVHLNEPHRLKQDSARIYEQQEPVRSMVSNDGKATLLIVNHELLSTKEGAEGYVAEVREVLDGLHLDSYIMAGKLYAQGVFIEKLATELLVFLSASVVLVFLFLLIAYRSWWGIFIPLFIVGMATIWILGVMAWVGKPLDLLMVLLPTIMFVVGMSDVVHLMTKYIENLRRGDPKRLAIKIAVKEVGLATFLTSITTAVGFLTLLTASIKPIREFGVYTALGVFIAFLVTFLFLPASWILLQEPKTARKKRYRRSWSLLLGTGLIYVMRHRVAVVVTALVLTILSGVGISLITTNSYLIEDVPQDDPLKISFTYFDEYFGGSRPFEAVIAVKDEEKDVFDAEVAQEVEKVNEYLAGVHGVGGLVSTNTPLKVMNQATNGGLTEAYRLPETAGDRKKIRRPMKRLLAKKELEGLFYTPDSMYGRISGRIGDIGSKISLEKNERFARYVTQQVDTSLVDITLTGTSNLIDKNNLYLAKNIVSGLCIAFGVVALIVGLLFRSARMVFIALLPNVIPLMMVAGIMGLFGITLKLSTSMIFTIAFGIAVDDTIHFTSKLKLELDKGKSLLYALKRTYLSTGKAIIVTSMILSGGFLILILSSFGGTFYTGLLISLTLIFAVIIDLTLLPALIVLFFTKKRFFD